MLRLFIKFCFLGLPFFILGCEANTQAPAPIRSTLPQKAQTELILKDKNPLELTTPHFTLRANISQDIAKQLLTDLEDLRAGLLDRYGISNTSFDVHLDILFIDNPEHYLAFSIGESSVAFYSRSALGPKIIINSSSAFRSKEDLWDILYHEYAHHFHAAYLGYKPPVWLNEGLAQYAESFRKTGNENYEFGFNEGAALSALKHQRAAWLPMENFIKEIKKYPIINGYYGEEAQARQSFFYAQSWLLTYWMLHTEEGEKTYENLVEQLDNGGDVLSAFPNDIQAILKAYSQSLAKESKLFKTANPSVFKPVEISQRVINHDDITVRLYMELAQHGGGKSRKIILEELYNQLKDKSEYEIYIKAIEAQNAFYDQRYSDSEGLLVSITEKTRDPDILRLNAQMNIYWMTKFLRNQKARRENTELSIKTAIQARPGDVALDLERFRSKKRYSQNLSNAQKKSLERILSSQEHKRSPLRALALVDPLINTQKFDEASGIISRAELWGEKNNLGFSEYIESLKEELRLNKKYAPKEEQ